MTTLAQRIRQAIATNDARLAGRIVDRLRFRYGFTYDDCYAAFHRNAPGPDTYTKADHDELMAEADDLESA